MQFLLCKPRKNLQFQFVKISSDICGKRNYCEKQGNSKELKKNDEIVPLKDNEAPNRLKEMANSIGRQLAILSPANSRTGRILWILAGVILILALWNIDKIRENRKKNKIVAYERMFFQKDYQKLIDRTTESIESNDYAEDHYYRGLAYFMLNEEDRALTNFRDVVERPDSHLALVSSSLCYSCYSFIKYKRYSDALDAINESININPHSSVSYKGKGEALMGLLRWEEALEAFNKSLSLDPDNSGCLNNMVIIYQKLKNNQKALEVIESILEKDMFNLKTHRNKLDVLLELKNFEKAVQEIEVIEFLFGQNVLLYIQKGETLTQLGRYQDALLNIELALFIDKGNLPKETVEKLLKLKELCQKKL